MDYKNIEFYIELIKTMEQTLELLKAENKQETQGLRFKIAYAIRQLKEIYGDWEI